MVFRPLLHDDFQLLQFFLMLQRREVVLVVLITPDAGCQAFQKITEKAAGLHRSAGGAFSEGSPTAMPDRRSHAGRLRRGSPELSGRAGRRLHVGSSSATLPPGSDLGLRGPGHRRLHVGSRGRARDRNGSRLACAGLSAAWT